jgi:hypothetical protein
LWPSGVLRCFLLDFVAWWCISPHCIVFCVIDIYFAALYCIWLH